MHTRERYLFFWDTTNHDSFLGSRRRRSNELPEAQRNLPQTRASLIVEGVGSKASTAERRERGEEGGGVLEKRRAKLQEDLLLCLGRGQGAAGRGGGRWGGGMSFSIARGYATCLADWLACSFACKEGGGSRRRRCMRAHARTLGFDAAAAVD